MKNILQKDTKIEGNLFPKGMKVSKAFRRTMNDKDFKAVDAMYGALLQSLFVKGNLCISIDPLDFLTMGDNSCGWSSCHSLMGDFKGGILSLLADNCTAVCYLESTRPYIFKEYEFSNKKWRQLIHIHPEEDFVIFNTDYPFEHKILLKETMDKLQKLFNKKMKRNLIKSDKPIRNIVYIKDYGEHYNDEVVHYNDLLLRRGDDKYTYQEVPIMYNKCSKPKTPIVMGAPPICPTCGERVVTVHKSLECNVCNPVEYCCTCAIKFHYDELHLIDKEYYCDECFDSEFTYCEDCDDVVRRSDFVLGYHQCEDDYYSENKDSEEISLVI